jgi:Ca-activated chloride channel family protein
MTDFHFLRPWWLLALPVLALLLWAWRKRQQGGGDWRDVCDPALLPHLLIGTASRPAQQPLWLAGLAGVLAALALAGPAWEKLPTPVFRNLSALVIVLDLSPAMNAADLKPSRLERARFKIEDLLRARKDGQTALVAYAGDAFTVTPLTDDTATIAAQLAALSPELMPVQGQRADLGLTAAERLLKQAGLKDGDILLISGGEGAKAAEDLAAHLHAQGYRVSALGVGTPDGAPVPLPQGGFLKDDQGNILLPRLDASALAALASAGGGISRALRPDTEDLNALTSFFDRPAEAQETTGTAEAVQWREAGVYLLPLLLPLAAFGFRRGWLGAALLLIALAPMPEPAMALEWQDLWLTPDQRAQRELEAGQAGEAAQRFQNPEWKAAAEYRAGQFPEAAKALQGLDTAASHYNRGNALANQGQYPEALKAYERALQLDPADQDAAYNKKLVEEALKKQQEQEKQDQKDQKDQKDQDGKQEQKQQQSQKNQDGQKDEQQPKDQQGEQQGQQDQQDQKGSPDQQQPKDQQEQQDQQGQDQQKPQQQPGQDQQDGKQAQKPQPDQRQEDAQQDQPADGKEPKPHDQAGQEVQTESKSETRQAEEQWLRRIPDDPGGLLKRKFYYQYRQRQQQQTEPEQEQW